MAAKAIILLALILSVSVSVRAQYASVQQHPVETCPTGSLLAFPKKINASNAVDRVYIRRSNSFDRRVWEMTAVPVPYDPTDAAPTNDRGIAFAALPLPRGRR